MDSSDLLEALEVNGRKRAQRLTIGPHTQRAQRASCFFCSSHVSEVLSIHLTAPNKRTGEGRPVEEVHFQGVGGGNKFGLRAETAGAPLFAGTRKRRGAER